MRPDADHHADLSRRALLEGAAALLLTPRMPQPSPQPLATAPIPASGERIARVGLGTWQTFDVNSSDKARWTALAETLRQFVAAGAGLIDTSPMYGGAEAAVGQLLAETGLAGKPFLATKVWTTGEGAGKAQLEDSFAKLRTTRIDLVQIHNLLDWRIHLRTLRRWKDQGRIRYLGITHYQASALADLTRIVRAEPIDFVQINLSLEEPDAAGSFLGTCAERKVAVIANRPFGGGGAFQRTRGKPLPDWAKAYQIGSWAQFLLKWVLSHPEVSCAIPGTGDPRHLLDNLGAARGTMPDPATRAQMERAWRDL